MDHWRCLLSWTVVLGCAGCPQPREAPEPTGAASCEELADCNCGAECGALDACVDGHCEQGRALLSPCRPGQQRRGDACEVEP